MNIEGVRGVINQLELQPTLRFNDDIRSEPSLQIYSHSQPSHAIPPIHCSGSVGNGEGVPPLS